MPLRATDNALVLPLLGLLLEQPRHQYALLAELRARYGWRVRTGSLYTLVGSLRDVGWIEPHDRGRSSGGDKPAPTVFRVTQAGADELARRVVADLTDPDPMNAPRFVMALAYIGILDRTTAIAALTSRVEVLRKRVDDWEQAITASGLAPIYMIETDFLASQTRHDIDWLERFIDRIADPNYVWPTGPRKRRKS